MNIQTLSVVVPGDACINHCMPCLSTLRDTHYPVLLDENRPDFDLQLREYRKRLEFAKDNGCNTLLLTGASEPQQNRRFLTLFGMMMQMMNKPFQNIEMQCTGALIDKDYLTFLHRHVGITTLALSLFSLDDEENMRIIKPPKDVKINAQEIAGLVHEAGINLRICINLTSHFDRYVGNANELFGSPENLFAVMKQLYKADQVTLRVLVKGNPENEFETSKWIKENAADVRTAQALYDYITRKGTLIGLLPHGVCKYDVAGISVVMDNASMYREQKVDDYKYLILRPDCRLYASWDKAGSMIF